MSELEKLVDHEINSDDDIQDAIVKYEKGVYNFDELLAEVYDIAFNQGYAQGFEAGVQAERERVVEWLEHLGDSPRFGTYKWKAKAIAKMLKGGSDAVK